MRKLPNSSRNRSLKILKPTITVLSLPNLPLREKEVTFRGLTLTNWWIQSIVKELLFLWRTLHVRTVS
nr:MAG TPA: hypothetical protein [Caudoviricetes sp.]